MLPSITLLIAIAGSHQSSVPSENLLQAIVGARVEVGDGRVVENGTVLMKGGIITEVNPAIKAPAGYEVLDGKGLTVYPGFIDAYTTKGVKLPDLQASPDDPPDSTLYASASMREANRKGIAPEIHAFQHLVLTEDLRKSYWNAGFTSAMVVSGAGNLGGFGTLVNLGGRPSRDSILVANTGMDCGLGRSSTGQGYPGTVLGYIAQTRQTLLDALWQGQVESAYTAGGQIRPPSDPSLEALRPILSGSSPVFFDADSRKWMERSLTVSAEFGLHPILVGAKEAWKITDRIRQDHIPIIVSLGFGKEPDPEQEPSPKPALAGKRVDAPGPDASTKKTEDDPEPKEQLGERQRLYREQLGNLIILSKAGIPFSFSTKSSKDFEEFMGDLRRAVKEGLPKLAVLRGLSLEAARLLGVERRLGTVEPGKIANLCVLSGDFLDPKTKTKFVFIDGRKIDPNQPPHASAPRPPMGVEN